MELEVSAALKIPDLDTIQRAWSSVKDIRGAARLHNQKFLTTPTASRFPSEWKQKARENFIDLVQEERYLTSCNEI